MKKQRKAAACERPQLSHISRQVCGVSVVDEIDCSLLLHSSTSDHGANTALLPHLHNLPMIKESHQPIRILIRPY